MEPSRHSGQARMSRQVSRCESTRVSSAMICKGAQMFLMATYAKAIRFRETLAQVGLQAARPHFAFATTRGRCSRAGGGRTVFQCIIPASPLVDG
jgi:hypothetical protein